MLQGARAKIVGAFCVCWGVCVVGKNLNTSNWSFMADDTITQGGIGVLGSPFYIYGVGARVKSLIKI